MQRNLNIKQRLVALVMLFAVCELYCGSTLFLHYHIVDNTRIWHSHPFASAHHADKQTVYDIAQLNSFVFVDDAETVDLRPMETVVDVICCNAPQKPVVRSVSHFCTRAPPIC
ncbi:MAG: hypothetical protein ACI31A_07715 [Candidatus Limisoma sp.]